MLQNIFSDLKVKNYFDKYQSIKNTFNLFEHYEKIKLPEKITFQKNKNKIKSNISKKRFKSIVKIAKNTLLLEISFKLFWAKDLRENSKNNRLRSIINYERLIPHVSCFTLIMKILKF